MKAKTILIYLLKFFGIILFAIVVTFVMAKLFPPPRGTAFDGLEYVLKPIYLSIISGFIYLLLAFTMAKYEKKYFLSALLLNLIYVVFLYLRIL